MRRWIDGVSFLNNNYFGNDMRSILLVGALVLAISGCVSTVGAKVAPNQLVGFQKGITTEADIVKKLGRPAVSTASSDGMKILTYSFSNYKMHGPFGGTDMQMSATTFMMGADGTMTSFQSSDTNFSTRKDREQVLQKEENPAQ